LSSNQYIKQLDGLRFIAVAFVMAGHWTSSSTFRPFLEYLSGCGVNLFFTLSGFLITRILIVNRDKESKGSLFKQFYIRRFLRIFPLYYLVLFICVSMNIPDSRGHFIYLVTYTTNIVSSFHLGVFGYMGHFWTLAVEEQFYIFFPMLVLLPKKVNINYFILLIAVAIASRAVLYYIFRDNIIVRFAPSSFTTCCLDAFAIGAILAYYRVKYIDILNRILQRKGIFITAILLCILFYILGERNHLLLSTLFNRTLFCLFCAWLIGIASTKGFHGLFGMFLNNKVVVYLGKISYGLYVFHFFMPYISGHIHLPFMRISYFIITVGLASASWFLFEKPINNLKRYFEYSGKQV
jgi:peptidoglycan/LPS O-acetylase OafA/YrhL